MLREWRKIKSFPEHIPDHPTSNIWVVVVWPFFISGVGLSPLGTAATSGLLYKPQVIDEGDCGAIGGIKIGRGNWSTRRKPAPAPLCPSRIPHDQTRARTRAAAVGSQRLTACLSYGATLLDLSLQEGSFNPVSEHTRGCSRYQSDHHRVPHMFLIPTYVSTHLSYFCKLHDIRYRMWVGFHTLMNR
jgi:hypothetical protein